MTILLKDLVPEAAVKDISKEEQLGVKLTYSPDQVEVQDGQEQQRRILRFELDYFGIKHQFHVVVEFNATRQQQVAWDRLEEWVSAKVRSSLYGHGPGNIEIVCKNQDGKEI